MSRRLLALLALSLSLLSIGFILATPPVAATQPTPVPLTVAAQPAQTFDCASVTEIPQSECQALVALYGSTHGSDWFNHTHWLQTPTPCSWYGVTCEAGHVTRLKLVNNRIFGALPTNFGQFTALQTLDLSFNYDLSGPVPPELGHLIALQYLGLAHNAFSGPLPPELGQLHNLQSLALGNNQLTGVFPPELGQLHNLQFLTLGTNQLSGPIPSELGQLHNLERLTLDHNHPMFAQFSPKNRDGPILEA